jgi:hypothetical protein
MKNLNNPVNVLLRSLDVNAVRLAEGLDLEHRHFQTLSAKRPPEFLMKMIEEKFPLKFVPNTNVTSEGQLDGHQKAKIVESLLNDVRSKNERKRELFLKSTKDTTIRVTVNTPQELRIEIHDLKANSSVTSSGNILTREFYCLLIAQNSWLELQKDIISAGIDLGKIWTRCAAKFPDGFSVENFTSELAGEVRAQTDARSKAILRIFVPFIEFDIIRHLFANLKRLHERRTSLNEYDMAQLERLKKWSLDQFRLSTHCFDDAMVSGKIILEEEGAAQRIKTGRKYPIPEKLRVGLAFLGDPPPLENLFGKEKK